MGVFERYGYFYIRFSANGTIIRKSVGRKGVTGGALNERMWISTTPSRKKLRCSIDLNLGLFYSVYRADESSILQFN